MSKANPARTTSVVWWILVPVFLFLTIFAFTLDIGDAAFAIAVFSFVMFLTAVIVAVIYGSRARKLDGILSGDGLLAHWTYSRVEWLQYAEKEYHAQKATKKTLFFIVAAFALIVGVVSVIVDQESGIWVLVAMLALIAIIGFVAWFSSWSDHRQNLKHQGEAYISKDGIYLNTQLHLWNHLAAYLGSVEYRDETPPLLAFSYFAPTRTGLEERVVRVPVPLGQEDKAKEVLQKFKAYVGKRG